MELFSVKRLESFEYIRVQELNLFLNRLYKSFGKPTILKDHLSDLSLAIISRMVLGKKYTEKQLENEVVTPQEFTAMVDE
ncbi:hypothetical protein Q0P53_13755, partial [Staphylococcus aureus]|nr:hypothetical protein [Staphylococcus aureus]